MVFVILQTVVSILLIVAILLQAQGGGLSTSFGGGGEFYRSRQSAEKFLIGGTIFLTIVFGVLSLLLLTR
jgi:protein translocase SecG subunit